MICPLLLNEHDVIVVEGTDLDIIGATTYIGESGDASAQGTRFYRRMLKMRPHRGPITVNHHPTGNNEILDTNVLRNSNA